MRFAENLKDGAVAEIDQIRFYRLSGKRSRNNLVVYNRNQNNLNR